MSKTLNDVIQLVKTPHEELEETIEIEKVYEYLLPKAKELSVPIEYIEWLVHSTAHRIVFKEYQIKGDK
jgi:hypothetical protein